MWLDKPRNANSPLAGFRVVELARVLAGPWAGQILADLGADVIKVESPQGDGTRQWGPPWYDRDGLEHDQREAAYYHACNRGKRSVVADFKDRDQLKFARDLCADVDIVIENFKPGTLDKYGLGYDGIAAINPAVIYCSISGFGQTGPRRDEAGYDFVAQAMSGLMSITGEPRGEPMKMGISISDLTCGLYSANAIQAGLLMRQRTGQGQWIDMSLLDCSVGLLASQATSYFATGENPPRMGNAHAQVSAYGVFPTLDGPVILAPANDGLFRKLLSVLQRNDLLGDERFLTNEQRLANREVLDGLMAEETAQWARNDLLEACAKAGVPAGSMNTIDQVFDEPQVRARGMEIEVGGLRGVRSPFNFNNAELAHDRPSPRLGEDDPQG